MAILTGIPGAFVGAAVDGEIIGVVLGIFGGHPVGVGGVAFDTILRKIGALVVRIYGSFIVIFMAIDTIISDPVEAQSGFRFMTVGAGSRGMRAHQRESIVLVQFGNIVHQPVIRIVAAGAVVSDRSVVHIGMAGNTRGIRVGKNKALVAGPAIRADMLTGEGKIGFGMAEPRGIPTDLPARCF